MIFIHVFVFECALLFLPVISWCLFFIHMVHSVLDMSTGLWPRCLVSESQSLSKVTAQSFLQKYEVKTC